MNASKRKVIVALSWAVALLWMMLIFHLSSQVAEQSNQLSKGVTRVIVETVEKVAPKTDFNMDTLNHFVRKNAHFFAYLVLGVIVSNAIRRCKLKGSVAFILALGICVLYAVSDEIHQLFVPGRGGQLKDVFIDSSGVVVGIGLSGLWRRLRRMSSPKRVKLRVDQSEVYGGNRHN